jgi:hypothetical protein
MKKFCWSLFWVVVLVCVMHAPVFAWGPVSHTDLAYRIMEDADINSEITWYGLNKDSVALAAGSADLTEPAVWHQNKWGDINSLDHMNASWMTSSRPVTNDNCGFLIHNVCDCAVPVDHCPACDVYSGASWAEDMFEYQGNGYSTPAWPSPAYYYANWWEYDNYVGYHINNMHSLAQTFKTHNETYWPCKYLHVCMTDWIDPDCRRAAMKFAWNVVWWYMGER